MDILIKAIQFFLSLSLLVAIHEFGHFIAARIFKIRVEKFYIFFDPWFSLFKFKRGDTEYGIGWVPLGGYVKIAGMIDESMDKEQMQLPPKPDEFRSKPAWQRFCVLVAGVVMNILLAFVIYCGISYAWGSSYVANDDIRWGYNFSEAGERLGFLPGDLQSKVDPYLRPLYDALFDMLGPETYNTYLEKGNIEVAPLAYMRGRTLDDSFIILDEAQNTSREQMKMFLTRLGFNSKMVITGDVTQIDLPADKMSGLKQAVRVLKDVEGIGICELTDQDVVRHVMVQRIIKAYADYESERNEKRKK